MFPDMMLWTTEQVIAWLKTAINQYNLTDIDLDQFSDVDGAQLYRMTSEDMYKLTGPHNAQVLTTYLTFLKKCKSLFLNILFIVYTCSTGASGRVLGSQTRHSSSSVQVFESEEPH